MASKLYIPIAGTWDRHTPRDDDWYRLGSPFDARLSHLGYTRFEQDKNPKQQDAGYWSGDLNGVLFRTKDWHAGGRALSRTMIRRRRELRAADEVALIAHSHGGQVLSFALATMFRADLAKDYLFNVRVVTVDMPVRRFGMKDTYAYAAAGVSGRWIHLYSKRFTWLRIVGSWVGPRKFKRALLNCKTPDGGHSGLLRDTRFFNAWEDILVNNRCP